ncbi:MAG: NAD-dependent epimerase/dehydratase family protein [Deltaproteobacteria bacterium]|nr:NAD-dependent epimerase/dehydratase family protein [Deltaproteobacteria bacterium]
MITGANGFVGRHLCAESIKRGWQVRAALRSAASVCSGAESVVVGQIDEQTDWTNALRDVDTIIHLAARVHVMRDDADDPLREYRRFNTRATERLARCAAAAAVKRLVFVSTIKVNGEETLGGHRYKESDAPAPQDSYGVSKWEAEEAIRRVAEKTKLQAVIVRSPLAYGAGVKGNFKQMLNVLARGIPLPFASVRNLRSFVSVGNLVDALVACASHPAAAGQTYLLSDGDDISTPELLRQLGAALGHPARLLPCPPALLRLVGRLTGRSDQVERLLGSLQIDSDKIRRELQWAPPVNLQDGLRQTAEWYQRTDP